MGGKGEQTMEPHPQSPVVVAEARMEHPQELVHDKAHEAAADIPSASYPLEMKEREEGQGEEWDDEFERY
jgi:hypothetical protein